MINKQNIRIVVCGPPMSGKSTWLSSLCSYETKPLHYVPSSQVRVHYTTKKVIPQGNSNTNNYQPKDIRFIFYECAGRLFDPCLCRSYLDDADMLFILGKNDEIIDTYINQYIPPSYHDKLKRLYSTNIDEMTTQLYQALSLSSPNN